MALPRELINEFVKMTKDDTPVKTESNTYGTVVKNGGTTYVKLDGADVLTPVITTTNVEDGERVGVMIKNHTAVITGNITSPSARTAEVEGVSGEVSQVKADIANVKILMADKVSTEKLEAQVGRIDELESKTAAIDEIKAQNVEISGKLAATEADVEYLKSNEAFVEHLNAITAKINEVVAGKITTDEFYAALADITVLAAGTATFDKATVKHLVAQAMNLEYGVGEQVFIKNLTVEFAQMVSASVGELCIKASDGNYYLLDVGADGSVTATKTTVSDSEITAGETSSGKVILETNIIAANLSTSNLLATYALVNKIDASRIDVDQFFARDAVIELLRTTKIVGDKTLTLIVDDVEDAKSIASSAQSTADSANAAAANAQTTADTAKANAATAQSTANNAQSTANAAQTAASNAQASADNLDRLTDIEVIEGTFVQTTRREGEGIHTFSKFGPKQDKTYGDPYPGGAGKNLLDVNNPITINRVTYEVVGDSIKVICTETVQYSYVRFEPLLNPQPGTQVTLSLKSQTPSAANKSLAILRFVVDEVTVNTFEASVEQPVTYTIPEYTGNGILRVQLYGNGEGSASVGDYVVYDKVQIELGPTATSYAPYANTPPIEGWTGLNAFAGGKNLLPFPYHAGDAKTENGVTFTVNEDGSITVNGTATASTNFLLMQEPDISPILPGVDYILSGCPAGGSSTTYRMRYQNNIGAVTDEGNGVNINVSNENIATRNRIYINIGSGATVSNLTFKPMLRLASDPDSSYAPYAGKTYALQFGETIYGGTVDWNAGEMTVEWAMQTMTGDENWTYGTYDNVGYLRLIVQDVVFSGNEKCSHLVWAGNVVAALKGNDFVTNANSIFVSTKIGNEEFDNADDWKAYLVAQNAAGTPVQAAYKLAEPYTIQLTPVQIETLKGINTVYTDADGGQVEFGHEPIDVCDSTVAPENPKVGKLWLDRSVTPCVLRRWTGDDWETVNDVSLIETVQDAILTKQEELAAEQAKTALFLKLDTDMKAVRIGQTGLTSEARVDAFGFGVVVTNEVFSRFEANRALFGNMEMRKPSAGGLALDAISTNGGEE